MVYLIELKKYPRLYITALGHVMRSETAVNPKTCLASAFYWRNTPEGREFWEKLDLGDVVTAKSLQPALFSEVVKNV